MLFIIFWNVERMELTIVKKLKLRRNNEMVQSSFCIFQFFFYKPDGLGNFVPWIGNFSSQIIIFGYQNKNHLIRLNYTDFKRTNDGGNLHFFHGSCNAYHQRNCTWQCSLSGDIAWRLWSHFLAMIMDVYLITTFVNKVIKRGTKGLLVNCSKSPHKTVTSNRDSKYRRRFYNYYTTSPSKSSEVTKYHIRKLLSQIQLLMLQYSSTCW